MKNYSAPNTKQFKFMFETCGAWTEANQPLVAKLKEEVANKDRDMTLFNSMLASQFEYLLAEMLKSSDDEIRVDLPRHLMFGGFSKFVDIITNTDLLHKLANASK